MNIINDLLKGEKVEWKTLGEVAKKISSGGTPKTGVEEYYNGEIPWLRTQEVGYGEIWDTDIKITEEGLKNSSAKWIPTNCVIIAMYGATVGRVGINKIPLTTNQACANIEVDDNIASYKYVYYCLLNQYEYIKSLGTGSQTNINAQIVKKLKIPLPPLPVQEKIAEILDRFTQLEAELEAELVLRKKQYNYYRNHLLTPDENSLLNGKKVEWKTLGEVCEMVTDFTAAGSFASNAENVKYLKELSFAQLIRTTDIKSKFKNEVNFIYVDEKAFNYLWRVNLNEDSIILPNVGNCGEVYYITPKDLPYQNNVLAPNALLLRSNSCNNKFLYYLFQNSNFQFDLSKITSNTGQTKFNKTNLKTIKIPIPPMEEQERITGILDKFDTLVNSISEGLPKEIELRRKQYQYYREKMLSF